MRKKIKIIALAVSKTTMSEEELSDLSIMESIYAIRRLKAAIDLYDHEIECEVNDSGHAFIESHSIWIEPECYI